MSKAEELAAQFVELYPQDLGPHHPAKWMMCDFLEQYGRLVQEAAAKEIEGRTTEYYGSDGDGPYEDYIGIRFADYIRSMELP